MRPLGTAVLAAAIVAMPASALAQSTIGVRGYASAGNASLAAKETFEAVADTSSRPVFGGGVQVTNIWRGIFADVGVSQLTLEGQRVFVHQGTVFELNIPLEITMRPVDVAAGWRFRFGRISPYAGAGVSFLNYEETSSHADSAENVRTSRSGPLGLGGVDIQVWRLVHAGAELRYRQVAKILGEAGVSAEFDEDDAGGFSFGLRISIGR